MHTLPDGVQLSSGRGGLPRLTISTRLAEAEIYLHGAHVTAFQPRGQAPVLFLSARSDFAPDRPIRGGVPICFPWFGARTDGGPGPMHGFARLADWELVDAGTEPDGTVRLAFALPRRPADQALWPAEADIRYEVRVGAGLHLALRVRNRGATPLRFEAALHTYLAVQDVRAVTVEGLAGAAFQDRLDPDRPQVQGPEPLRIAGETDRIYAPTRAACVVHDPGLGRRLRVEKSGSDTTVIWNPWIAKAQAMADFGDDEWPAMLCVETANVRAHAVTVDPGQAHTLTASIAIG